MTIYDRIRRLRINEGMTQDDLARAMGYRDRSMITKIEAGKVDISQTKIYEFAKALHTTPSYLMGWDEAAYEEAFANNEEDKKIDEMVDLYMALSEENKTAAKKYLQYLKSLEDA